VTPEDLTDHPMRRLLAAQAQLNLAIAEIDRLGAAYRHAQHRIEATDLSTLHYAQEAQAWRDLVDHAATLLHAGHDPQLSWRECRHPGCAEVRERALKISLGPEGAAP
jgi:hypothetical protein